MKKVITGKCVAIEVVQNDGTPEGSDGDTGQDCRDIEEIRFSKELLNFLTKNPVCGRSDYTELPGAKQNVRSHWRLFQNYGRRRGIPRSGEGQSASSSDDAVTVERQRKFNEARLKRQQRLQEQRQKKVEEAAKRRALYRDRKRVALLERACLEDQEDSNDGQKSKVVIISSPKKKAVNRHNIFGKVSVSPSKKERHNLFSVINAMKKGDDDMTSSTKSSVTSSNGIQKPEAAINEIASLDHVPPVKLNLDGDSGNSAKVKRQRSDRVGDQPLDEVHSSVSSTTLVPDHHQPILTTLVKTCNTPLSTSLDPDKEMWSVASSSSVKALADSSTERRMRRRKKRVSYIEWEEYDDLVDRDTVNKPMPSVASEVVSADIGQSVAGIKTVNSVCAESNGEKELAQRYSLTENVNECKGDEVSTSTSEDKVPGKQQSPVKGAKPRRRPRKGTNEGSGRQKSRNLFGTSGNRSISQENLVTNVQSDLKEMQTAQPPPVFSVDLSSSFTATDRLHPSSNTALFSVSPQLSMANLVSQPASVTTPLYQPPPYPSQPNAPPNFLLPSSQGFVSNLSHMLQPSLQPQTDSVQAMNLLNAATVVTNRSQGCTFPPQTASSSNNLPFVQQPLPPEPALQLQPLPPPPPPPPLIAAAVLVASGSTNSPSAMLPSLQPTHPINPLLSFQPGVSLMPSQTPFKPLSNRSLPNLQSVKKDNPSPHPLAPVTPSLSSVSVNLEQAVVQSRFSYAFQVSQQPPTHTLSTFQSVSTAALHVPEMRSGAGTDKIPAKPTQTLQHDTHLATVPTLLSQLTSSVAWTMPTTASVMTPGRFSPTHTSQLSMRNHRIAKSADQRHNHMRVGNSTDMLSKSQIPNQKSMPVFHGANQSSPAKRKAEPDLSSQGHPKISSGINRKPVGSSAPRHSSEASSQKIPEVVKSSKEKSLKEIDDMLNSIGSLPIIKPGEKKQPESKSTAGSSSKFVPQSSSVQCVPTTTALPSAHIPHENALLHNRVTVHSRIAHQSALPPPYQSPSSTRLVPSSQVMPAASANLASTANAHSHPLNASRYPAPNALPPPLHHLPYQQPIPSHQAVLPRPPPAYQQTHAQQQHPSSQFSSIAQLLRRSHQDPVPVRPKPHSGNPHHHSSSLNSHQMQTTRRRDSHPKADTDSLRASKTMVKENNSLQSKLKTATTVSKVSNGNSATSSASSHSSLLENNYTSYVASHIDEQRGQMQKEKGYHQSEMHPSQRSLLGESQMGKVTYGSHQSQPLLGTNEDVRAYSQFNLQPRAPGSINHGSNLLPPGRRAPPPVHQQLHPSPGQQVRLPTVVRRTDPLLSIVDETTVATTIVTHRASNSALPSQRQANYCASNDADRKISASVAGPVTANAVVNQKLHLNALESSSMSSSSSSTCEPTSVAAEDRLYMDQKPQPSQISAVRSTSYSSPAPSSAPPVTLTAYNNMPNNPKSGSSNLSSSILPQSMVGVPQSSPFAASNASTSDLSRYFQGITTATALTAFSHWSSTSTISSSSLTPKSSAVVIPDKKPCIKDLAAGLNARHLEESEEEDWHEDDSYLSADEMMDVKPNVSGILRPPSATASRVLTTDSSHLYSHSNAIATTGSSTVLAVSSYTSSFTSTSIITTTSITAASSYTLTPRSSAASGIDKKPCFEDLKARLHANQEEESEEEDWHEDDSDLSANSADEMVDIKPNINHSRFWQTGTNQSSHSLPENNCGNQAIAATVGRSGDISLKANANAVDTQSILSNVQTFMANLPANSEAKSKIALTLKRIKKERFSTSSFSPVQATSSPQMPISLSCSLSQLQMPSSSLSLQLQISSSSSSLQQQILPSSSSSSLQPQIPSSSPQIMSSSSSLLSQMLYSSPSLQPQIPSSFSSLQPQIPSSSPSLSPQILSSSSSLQLHMPSSSPILSSEIPSPTPSLPLQIPSSSSSLQLHTPVSSPSLSPQIPSSSSSLQPQMPSSSPSLAPLILPSSSSLQLQISSSSSSLQRQIPSSSSSSQPQIASFFPSLQPLAPSSSSSSQLQITSSCLSLQPQIPSSSLIPQAQIPLAHSLSSFISDPKFNPSQNLETAAGSAKTTPTSYDSDAQTRSVGVTSEIIAIQSVVSSHGPVVCTAVNLETTSPLAFMSDASSNVTNGVDPEVNTCPSLLQTLGATISAQASLSSLSDSSFSGTPVTLPNLPTPASRNDESSLIRLNFQTSVAPAYPSCIVAPQTADGPTPSFKEPFQEQEDKESGMNQPLESISELPGSLASTDVAIQSANLTISAIPKAIHSSSSQSSSTISPDMPSATVCRPEVSVTTYIASKPFVPSPVSPSNLTSLKSHELPLVIELSSMVSTTAGPILGPGPSSPSSQQFISARCAPGSDGIVIATSTVSSQNTARVIAFGSPYLGGKVTHPQILSSLSSTFPLSSSSVASLNQMLQSKEDSRQQSSCIPKTSSMAPLSGKATVISLSRVGELTSVQALPAVVVTTPTLLPPSSSSSSSVSSMLAPSPFISHRPQTSGAGPEITLGQSDLISNLIRVKTELSEETSESDSELLSTGILLSGVEFPADSRICLETPEDSPTHVDELQTGDIEASISFTIGEDVDKSDTMTTVNSLPNDAEAVAQTIADINTPASNPEEAAALLLSSSSSPSASFSDEMRGHAEKPQSPSERPRANQDEAGQSCNQIPLQLVIEAPKSVPSETSDPRSMHDINELCVPDSLFTMEDDLNAWQVRNWRSEESCINPSKFFSTAASTTMPETVSTSQSSGQFTVVIYDQNSDVLKDSKDGFSSALKQEVKDDQTLKTDLVKPSSPAPTSVSGSLGKFSVIISDQTPRNYLDGRNDSKSVIPVMKEEEAESKTVDTGLVEPAAPSTSGSGHFSVVISGQNSDISSDAEIKDVVNSLMKSEEKGDTSVSSDITEHSPQKIITDTESALKTEDNDKSAVLPSQLSVFPSSNENSLPSQLESEVKSSDPVVTISQSESQITCQERTECIEISAIKERDGQSSTSAAGKNSPQTSSEKQQVPEDIEIKSDLEDDDFYFVPDPVTLDANATSKGDFSNADNDPILIVSDDDDDDDEIVIYDDSPTEEETSQMTGLADVARFRPSGDGEPGPSKDPVSTGQTSSKTQVAQSSDPCEDAVSVISSLSSCSETSSCKITNKSIRAIGSWSREKVSAWLTKNKLDKICLNLSNLDGPGLQRMAFECHRDHEVFYSRVKKSLGLTMFNTLVIIRSLKCLIETDEDDIS